MNLVLKKMIYALVIVLALFILVLVIVSPDFMNSNVAYQGF